MVNGTIFRTHKSKDNPYVQINKMVFEDKRLSWAAKGLMGYLLSKPDNWEVRFYDLLNHGPEKRHALQRVLKELETCGYLRRKKKRDQSGRFQFRTDVFESPELAKASEEQSISAPVTASITPSEAQASAV